jgi:hypothetical protein
MINTSDNEDGGGFKIKIKNTNNLKIVKKQIQRGAYKSLEDVQREINSVIDTYKKKSYIT